MISGVPADDVALLARTAEAIDAARGVSGIAAVSDPLPSTETGEALLVEVTIAADADLQAVRAAAEHLRGIDAPEIDAAEVVVSGGPLLDDEINGQAQDDVARAEERRRLGAGRDTVAAAVAATTATAGRTILFSGLTVAVALAELGVFPDPFLRPWAWPAPRWCWWTWSSR